MADISMCLDDTCPSRFTCKRHEASGTKAGMLQSYQDWWRGVEDKCRDYWDVKQ